MSALPRLRPGPAARLAAICLFGALFAPLARADGALLTIVDGEATVIDGARRSAAASGLSLGAGTIVDSAAGAALVRIEWPNGPVLDLGPATRVMLAPPGFAARSGKLPVAYLLQGWVKLAGAGGELTGGIVTPAIELLPFTGVAVLAADRRERHAFAESGPLEIVERAGGKRTGVAAGALYAGAAGVLPRPDADWLARVPRAFRDAIPRRAASVAKRPAAAAALPIPAYAAVADWFTAEPALRKDFPRRFADWAAEPAFRRELLAHESAHPEWRPVLHPPPSSAPAR